MQAFSERLRKRANQLGFSDAEIARRTGLSERRYGHYVTGNREPDLATLIKISNTLGLTPNDLLLPSGGEDEHSERALLEKRFKAALNAVNDDDLHLALCQLECLVTHRQKQRAP